MVMTTYRISVFLYTVVLWLKLGLTPKNGLRDYSVRKLLHPMVVVGKYTTGRSGMRQVVEQFGLKPMSEWSSKFIVTEVDLLNRVLLAKARLVLAAGETRYFQETPISPDSARELFRLADINPYNSGSFTSD